MQNTRIGVASLNSGSIVILRTMHTQVFIGSHGGYDVNMTSSVWF